MSIDPDEFGYFRSPAHLAGWHLVSATLLRPGVYRVECSRRTGRLAEMRIDICRQEIVTCARELGYLSAPNGYTLPHE
jgi:hypothetical protein